jgi:hypothetical protein
VEQLGIADAVKGKAIHRNALDGGVAAITKGEAELGLYPLSEIIHEGRRARRPHSGGGSAQHVTRRACLRQRRA